MSSPPWIALAAAAVLVFWAVGAYNRLVRLRSRIAGRFSQVQQQVEQRHGLLLQWVDALSPLLEHEPGPQDAMRAACLQVQAACELARGRPSDARTVAGLRLAEETLGAARTRLAGELPAHVDRLLPGSAALGVGLKVAEVQEALAAAENTLAFARHQFNDAVQDYNDAVLQFPTWIVAGMFRFRAAGTL